MKLSVGMIWNRRRARRVAGLARNFYSKLIDAFESVSEVYQLRSTVCQGCYTKKKSFDFIVSSKGLLFSIIISGKAAMTSLSLMRIPWIAMFTN